MDTSLNTKGIYQNLEILGGFGVMVQDVVATLDGQSGGCALIGSYTSLHTRVHHKGGDRGSFTYSWYFLGLMFVCMCVSRILWCVQLSNGSMLLIVQMCANMYLYVCGGRVYLSSDISRAVQVYFQKPCVCPQSAAMEMSECTWFCLNMQTCARR